MQAMDVRDKVVVITGASLGIGRETAYAFAAAGASLALTYNAHADEGDAVAARCRRLGAPEVLLVHLDLADRSSPRQAVGEIVAGFAAADVLINNAGVVTWKRFAEQSLGEIEHQIRVDLSGVLELTHHALPHVRDAVVNVVSTASLHGTATLAPYCAAKWGLRGFTKALALERPDLRIVAVHPTVTATRMNDCKGMPPERVADVILRVVSGEIAAPSGADIDVRDHILEG
jgi:NAD(P)-dependent dehydrogenase (short-subunit alcohol dehydrogenase family)